MVNPRRERSRDEEGFALGLAVVALLLLAVGASLLAMDLGSRLRVDRDAGRGLRLRLACDAALAKSLASLDESGSVPTWGPEPFGRGTIEARGESIGSRRWLLTATAAEAGLRRQVRLEVQRAGSTLRVVRWERLE